MMRYRYDESTKGMAYVFEEELDEAYEFTTPEAEEWFTTALVSISEDDSELVKLIAELAELKYGDGNV